MKTVYAAFPFFASSQKNSYQLSGRYAPNPHAEQFASVDGSRIRRKKKISESSNSVTFNNSKLSTSVVPSSSRGSSILARCGKLVRLPMKTFLFLFRKQFSFSPSVG